MVLTGSLLALDAPVVGSGATRPNATGADTGIDKDGFFAHWGDLARERGVEVLYRNSELDLEAVIAAEPDLIVISAGFDAHKRDPLGGLRLVEADFMWATEALGKAAERHCKGRMVSMLEGGYDLDALATSVAVHVRTLMDLGS